VRRCQATDCRFLQTRMQVAIDNVLHAFMELDTLKIKANIKLHMLPHMPDDIRRFGPLVGRITESMESSNAIFRACSFHSNKLAASKDIGAQFAAMEGFKYLVSGGAWLVDGKLFQASVAVREFFFNQRTVQQLLGWRKAEPDARPGESFFGRSSAGR
jgi:hypothetical protein